MYIGSCLDDQLWLAMVPNTYMDHDNLDNTPERLPVLDALTTALTTPHRLRMIMFIAYVLSDMAHEDIDCISNYPEPLSWESVKNSTEVL